MADFTRKKLQIFVSSTFSDLIPERQAAVEAILTAGHIPAGMELFTAGDESQMEVIKQWIDESDAYLLILGSRYGSIEPKIGKSYTHLEYEYALVKGKPFFACVIKDEAIEPRLKAQGFKVLDPQNSNKLAEFRAQVLSNMCKFWEDSKDIKIAVTETLAAFARRDDLVGWVRSNTQSNLPALADEMARLSKENAQLRQQLAQSAQIDRFNGVSFQELKSVLEEDELLGILMQHRQALSTGFDANFHSLVSPAAHAIPRAKLQTLEMRGLLQLEEGIRYRLTESARAFLNKLDASRLAAGGNLQEPVGSSAPTP